MENVPLHTHLKRNQKTRQTIRSFLHIRLKRNQKTKLNDSYALHVHGQASVPNNHFKITVSWISGIDLLPLYLSLHLNKSIRDHLTCSNGVRHAVFDKVVCTSKRSFPASHSNSTVVVSGRMGKYVVVVGEWPVLWNCPFHFMFFVRQIECGESAFLIMEQLRSSPFVSGSACRNNCVWAKFAFALDGWGDGRFV